MSADNWTVCPRCKARAAAKNEELIRNIKAQYGKVSLEEWDKLNRELYKKVDMVELQDPTFREDYEIYGADEGVVSISYSGNCTECGLHKVININEPIEF